MEIVSGKELMDSFGGLSKSMDSLKHLIEGHVECEHCSGTGWCESSPLHASTKEVLERITLTNGQRSAIADAVAALQSRLNSSPLHGSLVVALLPIKSGSLPEKEK